MQSKIFSFPVIIRETYLDSFEHMNNAVYLTLFEQARWELITQNGYGLEKIKQTQLGPVILEIKLNFLKELCLRDEVEIQTQLISYERKIGKLIQQMVRHGEVCATAEVVFGLFSLQERKLVPASAEWLKAVGVGS